MTYPPIRRLAAVYTAYGNDRRRPDSIFASGAANATSGERSSPLAARRFDAGQGVILIESMIA